MTDNDLRAIIESTREFYLLKGQDGMTCAMMVDLRQAACTDEAMEAVRARLALAAQPAAEPIEAITLQQRIDEVAALFGSLREAASIMEIDVGYLSRLRSGEKTEPSADVLAKLGLTRHVTYTVVRRNYKASPLIQRTRSA